MRSESRRPVFGESGCDGDSRSGVHSSSIGVAGVGWLRGRRCSRNGFGVSISTACSL